MNRDEFIRREDETLRIFAAESPNAPFSRTYNCDCGFKTSSAHEIYDHQCPPDYTAKAKLFLENPPNDVTLRTLDLDEYWENFGDELLGGRYVAVQRNVAYKCHVTTAETVMELETLITELLTEDDWNLMFVYDLEEDRLRDWETKVKLLP